MYDSYYRSVDDNSIINPSIRSTLIIPHSIESNQSATHSVFQTDPKLNIYARDFQPSIPGSQNIDDQNTEIMISYEECNLDSNDESTYFHSKRQRVKHFNRIIRNKFDIDLLLVSETKIDISFPTS